MMYIFQARQETRISPWMRFPFGLTVDDDVLTWIKDVILRGLQRYSRRLRHWRHRNRVQRTAEGFQPSRMKGV